MDNTATFRIRSFRSALQILRENHDAENQQEGAQEVATDMAADFASAKKEEGVEKKEGAQEAAADMPTDSAIANKDDRSPSTPPKSVDPKRKTVEPLPDSVKKRSKKEACTQRFVSQ